MWGLLSGFQSSAGNSRLRAPRMRMEHELGFHSSILFFIVILRYSCVFYIVIRTSISVSLFSIA